MKQEELKLRVVSYAEDLVDNIMPQTSVINKLKNATAKFWIKQNSWKIDEIIHAFVDANGCIDPKEVLDTYEMALFENGEFVMNPQDLIPDNMEQLKSMIPNKIIVFHKHDLYKLLGIDDTHFNTTVHANVHEVSM